MSQNTGHAINAGNFEQLISVLVSFGISYNPTAVGLKLVGMNSKLMAANGVVGDVAAKLATQDSVDADREYLFDGLPARVTQIIGYYNSTGADPNRIEDAREFQRKILGKRATPIVPPDPNDPNPPKTISSAQTTFTQKIEHFDGLVEVVNIDSLYDPNEVELKVVTLNAFSTQLHGANTASINAGTDTATARIARDHELYDPATGLVPVALRAKEYVKALFGASSPQYNQVKGIKFRNIA